MASFLACHAAKAAENAARVGNTDADSTSRRNLAHSSTTCLGPAELLHSANEPHCVVAHFAQVVQVHRLVEHWNKPEISNQPVAIVCLCVKEFPWKLVCFPPAPVPLLLVLLVAPSLFMMGSVVGSVDIKLWASPSLKREYELILQPDMPPGFTVEVHYGFCLSTFLANKLKSDKKNTGH